MSSASAVPHTVTQTTEYKRTAVCVLSVSPFHPRMESVDKSHYKSQTRKIGGGAMLPEGRTDRQTDVRTLTVALRNRLEEQEFCSFLQKRVLKLTVIKQLECYLGIKDDGLRFEAIFQSLRPITVRRIRRHVSNRSRTPPSCTERTVK